MKDDVNMARFEEFYNAAVFGDRETTLKLLAENPSLAKEADDHGFTALHGVVGEDRVEIAELLIQHGADVHAKNEMGMTPLHIAQWAMMVEVLVRQGADLNALSKCGLTPLHVQAQEGEDTGSLEVMGALLKAGANPNIADNRGMTPLAYARQRDEQAKISLLRAHGAK